MAALPIIVNLIPGYNHVPPVVKLNQYEYGFTRQFEVYYGDDEYTIPSGATIRIEGTKLDGTGYSYSTGVVSASGNVVTVVIQEQMTALAGLHRAEIIIIPSLTKRASTINLIMDVEKGALSQDIPISDTEIPAVIDAAHSHALAASISEANAKTSETKAKTSETNAKTSENNAKASETTATIKAAAASTSASNASTSAANAKVSETNAKNSENMASGYADSALASAQRAEDYADLVIPTFHIDSSTMNLIQDESSSRLTFSYSASTGNLSYTVN